MIGVKVMTKNANISTSFFLQFCTKTHACSFGVFCVFVFYVITFVPVIWLRLSLVWNVCGKSIWTHSAPLCDYVIHGWSLMGTQLYWLFWEKGCLLIAVWWYALHTTGDSYSLTTNPLRISGQCQCSKPKFFQVSIFPPYLASWGLPVGFLEGAT